jgi:ribosomal protein S18 acetylase RimI-like enzyme
MTEIRPARLDDDAALLAIDDLNWTSATSPAERGDVSEFFHGRTPEDTLVAEIDGRVVGYATLRAATLPSRAHVVDVNGVAVHPDAAGRGVGRAVIEAAFAEAVRRGARKVALRVLASNAAARRLYARCGFVEEGVLREEFLLDGRYVDDVFMARYAAASSRQSSMGSAQSGQGTS